jgi:hypothetical protein
MALLPLINPESPNSGGKKNGEGYEGGLRNRIGNIYRVLEEVEQLSDETKQKVEFHLGMNGFVFRVILRLKWMRGKWSFLIDLELTTCSSLKKIDQHNYKSIARLHFLFCCGSLQAFFSPFLPAFWYFQLNPQVSCVWSFQSSRNEFDEYPPM